MKAAFGVEAIGYGTWLSLRDHKLLARAAGAHDALGLRGLGSQYRPWLAVITGPDARYGLAREFIRPKIDYRESNSKATRGIRFWWTLDPGRVYETRYLAAWSRQEHRFLAVNDAGEIRDITREEVLAWASSISASTS